MLCDSCADCANGKCLSDLDACRRLFGAAKRDQFEIEVCDGYNQGDSRGSLREELERCVLDFLAAARGWNPDAWKQEPGGFETFESYLQFHADDCARYFRGGQRLARADELDEWIPWLSDDIHKRLVSLLVDCPELEKAKGQRYRITWRLTKWTSGGGPSWGSSKPIPQPQREKFNVPESWEIILSLPVWMLLDDAGRDRLLHHELMHAATGDRHHPVQEFPETVARFGAMSRDQALMAIAAIAHPKALERIERWGLLPETGQVRMFADREAEIIEVRVPMQIGAD